MSNASLPAPLDAFRQAVNAGDRDGFIGLFSADAAVDDWGRRFAGHQSILGWSDKELLGAHGTLTYNDVIAQSDNQVTLNTHWASSVFTGASVFRFTLKNGQITELKIASH